VGKLDLENQRCYVEETGVNYYTDSIVKTDIKMLEDCLSKLLEMLKAALLEPNIKL